ncbi:MAG: PH domain-containing protein [Bacteroidales bacterium]|nr:PH domain-containing protein [Bacteroidales bacterium]
MTNDFSNSIIPPENLPTLEAADFNPLDPKYLKLIYIRLTITSVIMLLSGLGFGLLVKDKFPVFAYWIIGGFMLISLAYSFIISQLSFPYRGYLIREKDIAYKQGLIRFTHTSIPFIRIQHVELIQGVIAKQMNLATIKIFTAGGSSDDLSIPGLPIEKARQIREFLTGKISSDDKD